MREQLEDCSFIPRIRLRNFHVSRVLFGDTMEPIRVWGLGFGV